MVLPNSLSSYYEKFLTTGEVKCIDEEIPFEIPKGWEWARINAIGVSQLGKTLDRGKESGKEYPYLCSINVYWDSINLSKIKTFRLRDDELPKYKLRKGDLLICEGGDYGRCCIWDRNEDMYYQNALHRVRFHGGLIPSFYKYVFELYRNIGYIVGQGQTIKHFTYENMRSILFPVPSIHEQKRIVSRIEEIQPIVKKYQRTEDALKRLNTEIFDKLKKSILQEAIQGKLVSQITEEGTAQELLKQIKTEKEKLVKKGKLKKSALTDSVIYKGDDNKYYEQVGKNINEITDEIAFDLPDGWIWCRLKDICSIFTGATFKKEEATTTKQGIRILRGGNISPFELKIKDDDIFLTEDKVKKDILLKENDILTPAVTSLENIGKMARVDKNMPYTTVGGFVFIIRLHLIDQWLSKYILCLLSSPFMIEFMKSITNKSGQAFYNIGKERLSAALLPIPSLMEQQRIVAQIEKLFEQLR